MSNDYQEMMDDFRLRGYFIEAWGCERHGTFLVSFVICIRQEKEKRQKFIWEEFEKPCIPC